MRRIVLRHLEGRPARVYLFGSWEERVCAENTFEYYQHNAMPVADKPDF